MIVGQWIDDMRTPNGPIAFLSPLQKDAFGHSKRTLLDSFDRIIKCFI